MFRWCIHQIKTSISAMLRHLPINFKTEPELSWIFQDNRFKIIDSEINLFHFIRTMWNRYSEKYETSVKLPVTSLQSNEDLTILFSHYSQDTY